MTTVSKDISAQSFIKVCQSDQAPLIIDVRTPAEVAQEFLPGCVNLPLHEVTAEKVQQLVADSSGPAEVYILCASSQRAKMAAKQLAGGVSAKLCVIDGGMQALKQAGADIKKGEGKVISLERQVRIAAGTLVVTGVVLGSLVHSGFYALSAFVGAGLIFAGITNTCGMGLLLARMPWNRRGTEQNICPIEGN